MIDNARSLALLRKLDHLLGRRPQKASAESPLPAEDVHQIRTTARRVEALLEILAAHPDRRQRNLRKRLRRLRRGAGSLRDIDVQIAALRKLKIGREQERKARLMQMLLETRGERERKMLKALDHKSVQKVRKALRRWSTRISAANQSAAQLAGRAADRTSDSRLHRQTEFDGVSAALRQFSTLSRQVRSLTPENLHAYRTRCKRMRYVAEMAGETSAAKRVVTQLKRIQDAAGDWHDWQTLTASAESLFARSQGSALVAALHNVTNAKFVEARSVGEESRRNLLALYRAMLAEKRTRAPRSGPGLAKPVTRTPKPAARRKSRTPVANMRTARLPATAVTATAPEAAPHPAVRAPSASVTGATSIVA